MITFNHYLIEATCLEEVPADIVRLEGLLEQRRYARVYAQSLQMEAYRNADWVSYATLTADVNYLDVKEWAVVYAIAELKQKLI